MGKSARRRRKKYNRASTNHVVLRRDPNLGVLVAVSGMDYCSPERKRHDLGIEVGPRIVREGVNGEVLVVAHGARARGENSIAKAVAAGLLVRAVEHQDLDLQKERVARRLRVIDWVRGLFEKAAFNIRAIGKYEHRTSAGVQEMTDAMAAARTRLSQFYRDYTAFAERIMDCACWDEPVHAGNAGALIDALDYVAKREKIA